MLSNFNPYPNATNHVRPTGNQTRQGNPRPPRATMRLRRPTARHTTLRRSQTDHEMLRKTKRKNAGPQPFQNGIRSTGRGPQRHERPSHPQTTTPRPVDRMEHRFRRVPEDAIHYILIAINNRRSRHIRNPAAADTSLRIRPEVHRSPHPQAAKRTGRENLPTLRIRPARPSYSQMPRMRHNVRPEPIKHHQGASQCLQKP